MKILQNIVSELLSNSGPSTCYFIAVVYKQSKAVWQDGAVLPRDCQSVFSKHQRCGTIILPSVVRKRKHSANVMNINANHLFGSF